MELMQGRGDKGGGRQRRLENGTGNEGEWSMENGRGTERETKEEGRNVSMEPGMQRRWEEEPKGKEEGTMQDSRII